MYDIIITICSITVTLFFLLGEYQRGNLGNDNATSVQIKSDLVQMHTINNTKSAIVNDNPTNFKLFTNKTLKSNGTNWLYSANGTHCIIKPGNNNTSHSFGKTMLDDKPQICWIGNESYKINI